MSDTFRTGFTRVEEFMQICMNDSAHDIEHVYRVLKYAIDIARHEGQNVNIELLSIACLLHDIGRAEQYADPSIDHAVFGADKAYNWLVSNGFTQNIASEVKNCISTHRFRSDSPPCSIEAKILFDADKLDACGVVGIARTLLHQSHAAEPLYSLTKDGEVSDGTNDLEPSFLQEYKFKLEKLYDRFHTKHGLLLAQKRKIAAKNFYDTLLSEIRECHAIQVN